mgnify:CR=1 FL=1
MKKKKLTLALVAHDNMKRDLAEWVEWNWESLIRHHLVCTGTTGRMVEKTLSEHHHNPDKIRNNITLLKSGPLGGDQQLGALIYEGEIDTQFFFWDPMQGKQNDGDVKALLRQDIKTI